MIVKTRKFKNRHLAKVIRDATKFYINNILPESKTKKLEIIVKQTANTFADGSCWLKSKNQYEIEIGSHIVLEQKLVTLAHECVHVKQYRTKQLKTIYVGDHLVDVWKGKRYRNLHYDDQPWEMEALDLEDDLFFDFVSECYALGKLDLDKIKS